MKVKVKELAKAKVKELAKAKVKELVKELVDAMHIYHHHLFGTQVLYLQNCDHSLDHFHHIVLHPGDQSYLWVFKKAKVKAKVLGSAKVLVLKLVDAMHIYHLRLFGTQVLYP